MHATSAAAYTLETDALSRLITDRMQRGVRNFPLTTIHPDAVLYNAIDAHQLPLQRERLGIWSNNEFLFTAGPFIARNSEAYALLQWLSSSYPNLTWNLCVTTQPGSTNRKQLFRRWVEEEKVTSAERHSWFVRLLHRSCEQAPLFRAFCGFLYEHVFSHDYIYEIVAVQK